jgi:hypothetical protein
MRAGVKVGYKSTNGDVQFSTVNPFLEYIEFQKQCMRDMQDSETDEEVTEVTFVMKRADVNRFETDLRINGDYVDSTEFKEKANQVIYRGMYLSLDGVQLKVYFG